MEPRHQQRQLDPPYLYTGPYLEARHFSPLGLLDHIAMEQIVVLNRARESVERLLAAGQPLTDDVNEKYEYNAARSVEYGVDKMSSTRAFVKGTVSVQNIRHIVDMLEMTCTCKMWALLGYPCVHAIAAAKVGRCRLTISKPTLKARLISELEIKM